MTGRANEFLTDECANAVLETCERNGIISGGAIDLDLTRAQLCKYFDSNSDLSSLDEYHEKKEEILEVVLRSRYVNLYNLLRDRLDSNVYMSIVRNQILVDLQGEDLLFQIYILQRKPGDEAPFFEFIQRVCACPEDDRPVEIKPGCGGFGIRNFLTLFLSIEVGKAMQEVSNAKEKGDLQALNLAKRKVEAFTDQLSESNPILTEIADAMTEEGEAQKSMQDALSEGDKESAKAFEVQMEQACAKKVASNEKLMECSSKYNDLMKKLRLESQRR